MKLLRRLCIIINFSKKKLLYHTSSVFSSNMNNNPSVLDRIYHIINETDNTKKFQDLISSKTSEVIKKVYPSETCIIKVKFTSVPVVTFPDAVHYVKSWIFGLTKPYTGFKTLVFLNNKNSEGERLEVRGATILPFGSTVLPSLAVISNDKRKLSEASEAGADFVGNSEVIHRLAEGSACDYDFIIGTPETEVEFKKFAKYLKEKIPNVKRGTLVDDVVSALKLMKNSIRYKSDAQGVIFLDFGASTLTVENLQENLWQVLQSIKKSIPAAIKTKKFIEKVYIGAPSCSWAELHQDFLVPLKNTA
jgi:ribosomal protein L1